MAQKEIWSDSFKSIKIIKLIYMSRNCRQNLESIEPPDERCKMTSVSWGRAFVSCAVCPTLTHIHPQLREPYSPLLPWADSKVLTDTQSIFGPLSPLPNHSDSLQPFILCKWSKVSGWWSWCQHLSHDIKKAVSAPLTSFSHSIYFPLLLPCLCLHQAPPFIHITLWYS